MLAEGVERGLKVKAMGFTAAKFDPFPGPWRSFVDRRDEDFAIDYVRAMRQALGSKFELLIESHRRHRRGDLFERGILRMSGQARGRHLEPRYLRHGRDYGDARHCGNGAAAGGGDGAT